MTCLTIVSIHGYFEFAAEPVVADLDNDGCGMESFKQYLLIS
jgi:hypothetical protein